MQKKPQGHKAALLSTSFLSYPPAFTLDKIQNRYKDYYVGLFNTKRRHNLKQVTVLESHYEPLIPGQ